MKSNAVKRTLAFLICVIMICSVFPFGSFATEIDRVETVVNVNSEQAKVVQSTTVYAGEIFVDGVSAFKYLYSEDITRTSTVLGAVLDAFRAMDDKEFAPLVPGVVGEDGVGLAECSVASYADEMDESWKDAANVAKKYYPELPLAASSSVDLFETDSAFAAACPKYWEGVEIVDTAGNPFELCGPLGTRSATNTDTVTYTVIDGQLVKNIDRDIDYTCESVTVIYTRAEVGDNYKGFPDVANGDWYYDAVKYCATRGFINGYGNGKFGPADALQRQDFVVILAKIAGADVSGYTSCKLTDVDMKAYYGKAVAWAVDKGIISGYQNGKFGVGDKITREQVATILYRYMGSPDVDTSVLNKFPDKGNISSFAVNAFAWANTNDIINGKADGKLAPVATASRAEIAVIIMRMDQQGMFA